MLGSKISLQQTQNSQTENYLTLIYTHKTNQDEKIALHIIPVSSHLSKSIDGTLKNVDTPKQIKIDDKVLTFFDDESYQYVLLFFKTNSGEALKIATSIKFPSK